MLFIPRFARRAKVGISTASLWQTPDPPATSAAANTRPATPRSSPAAEAPARAAARLESVSKVSLGLIKTLRNGPPAIKFLEECNGCLLVKVRGASALQEIRVYTTDAEEARAAMTAAFTER